MIQITEEKVDKMSEHMEKILKHAGKMMQCIEGLGEDDDYDDEGYNSDENDRGRSGGRRMRVKGYSRY